METFGVVSNILGIFLGPILEGLVFVQMWRWFVIPTFHVPDVSVAAAIGLGFLISMATYHFRPISPSVDEDESTRRSLQLIGATFLNPLLILVAGWIVHFGMPS